MRRSIEDAIRAPVNGDRDMEMNESRPSMSTFNEPVPTSQSLIVWSVEQEKISLSSVQQRADTLPLWPDNVRSGRSFHSVGEIWMNGYSSITNVLGHNWPYQFKINFITKWIWFLNEFWSSRRRIENLKKLPVDQMLRRLSEPPVAKRTASLSTWMQSTERSWHKLTRSHL